MIIQLYKIASKTHCGEDSLLLNFKSQSDIHLKNLEDSLTLAMKTKNEMIFEVKYIAEFFSLPFN